jgi:Domain of unknown function (DUF4145)
MFNEDYSSHLIPGWAAYQCSNCFGLVGASGQFRQAARQNFQACVLNQAIIADELVPRFEAVSDRLPIRVRRYLEQAKSSLSSPDGAVMLAGSAVDAMLKEKGYVAGTLYSRITDAPNDHLITTDMAKWAHSVRLDSNRPRHADVDDPHASIEDAKRSIDFATAFAEIIFVLPAMIAEGIIASNTEE